MELWEIQSLIFFQRLEDRENWGFRLGEDWNAFSIGKWANPSAALVWFSVCSWIWTTLPAPFSSSLCQLQTSGWWCRSLEKKEDKWPCPESTTFYSWCLGSNAEDTGLKLWVRSHLTIRKKYLKIRKKSSIINICLLFLWSGQRSCFHFSIWEKRMLRALGTRKPGVFILWTSGTWLGSNKYVVGLLG